MWGPAQSPMWMGGRVVCVCGQEEGTEGSRGMARKAGQQQILRKAVSMVLS